MGRNNRVTLADIASRANVDISTVSLVLNHKARAKKPICIFIQVENHWYVKKT